MPTLWGLNYIDLGLIVVIGFFGFLGFWYGIVWRVVSLIGTICGIYLATRFYAPVSDWVIGLTGWAPNFSKILIFIVVFVAINRITYFIFWLINKGLAIVTHLPIVRSLDRLLGFGFGVLEGVLALGMLFYFVARFPVGVKLMEQIGDSKIVPYTVKVAGLALPLVPDSLKALKSTIEGLL